MAHPHKSLTFCIKKQRLYLYATLSSHLICLLMQDLETLHYEYKNVPVTDLCLYHSTDGKCEHYHWIKTLDFQHTKKNIL